MHTKFKKWYTKELDNSHWKWIVSAEVDSNTPKGKRKFLNWMKETFGEPANRWSIRWSMLGVDIRFHEPKDYFRFTMFHSIDPEKE
jgi:hypothetical protein